MSTEKRTTNKSTTSQSKMVSFRVPNHLHEKLPKGGLTRWLLDVIGKEIGHEVGDIKERKTNNSSSTLSGSNLGGVRSRVVEIGVNFVKYGSREAAIEGSGMSIDTIRRRIKSGTEGFWQAFEDGTIQGLKPDA